MERWLPAIGFEGRYEVSDLGRVRSFMRGTGRVLLPDVGRNGYHRVALWGGIRANTKKHLVHRLVLAAFVGPSPAGMEARHKDGDSGNNSLSNLEWATHSDNLKDRTGHGKLRIGAEHPKARLTEALVLALRRGDITPAQAAQQSGCSAASARRAKNGESWGWL